MSSTSHEETKPLFERLTRTVVPSHYDLTVKVALDTFKFGGTVIINIEVCFFITNSRV